MAIRPWWWADIDLVAPGWGYTVMKPDTPHVGARPAPPAHRVRLRTRKGRAEFRLYETMRSPLVLHRGRIGQGLVVVFRELPECGVVADGPGPECKPFHFAVRSNHLSGRCHDGNAQDGTLPWDRHLRESPGSGGPFVGLRCFPSVPPSPPPRISGAPSARPPHRGFSSDGRVRQEAPTLPGEATPRPRHGRRTPQQSSRRASSGSLVAGNPMPEGGPDRSVGLGPDESRCQANVVLLHTARKSNPWARGSVANLSAHPIGRTDSDSVRCSALSSGRFWSLPELAPPS